MRLASRSSSGYFLSSGIETPSVLGCTGEASPWLVRNVTLEVEAWNYCLCSASDGQCGAAGSVTKVAAACL